MKLEDAQRQLEAWESASLAVASGKSYQVGNRMLTRVNWPEIRDAIEYFKAEVNKARLGLNSHIRVGRLVPGDN